jgi:hypothetical protein
MLHSAEDVMQWRFWRRVDTEASGYLVLFLLLAALFSLLLTVHYLQPNDQAVINPPGSRAGKPEPN